MALENENGGSGMVMPVQPMNNGYSNGGGFGFPYPVFMGGGMGGMGGGNGGFGDGWGILLLVIIIAALGGNWGGNGNGGGFFGGNGGLGTDFPWLMNGQQGINNNVSSGFRDAQLQDSVTSVRDGISNLSTQICDCCGNMQMNVANGFANVQQSLCSGFAGTTAAVTGAQTAISQQLYNNEIASLNRSFAEQTANTAGFNGVQSALCDIRYAEANNTRDIIESQTRGTQLVLDKLCSLELDNYKRENDQLRTQLNMANLAASQISQTSQIRDGQTAAVNALVNELRSCPIPSQPVYGSQPIFTCPNNNNNGCGCGCGGNGF